MAPTGIRDFPLSGKLLPIGIQTFSRTRENFVGAGFDIMVEDSSSHARLDMAVCFNRNVYLFEFKVVERAEEGAAMAQLRERRYADKYRARGEPIHLVAVEFSATERNVVGFEVETA